MAQESNTEIQVKETANDRGHASLGGSTASRWMSCPGSVILTKDLPTSPPSQAALNGTEAHEYAEKALRSFLNYKVTGEWDCQPDFSDIIPEEKHDEMLPMVSEYVKTVWIEVLLNAVTGKVWGMEDNFTLSADYDMSGYVDFWCVYKDKKGKRILIILDFKYGYHYVSAKRNAQLAFYACALREMLIAAGKDIDYARCGIYQPRNKGIENKAYREVKYSAKQLDSWRSKFLKAGHLIVNAKSTKTKAGSHCHWCGAKAICTKYLKHTHTQTDVDMLRDEVKLPEVSTLTDEQLLKLFTYSDLITDYIDSLKGYILGRHNDGKPVKGLKVVNSATRRKWIDDEEAIKDWLESAGLSEDTYMAKKLKGITLVEKKLPKELREDMNKALVTNTEPKPTVVVDNEFNAHKTELVSEVALLGD